MLQLQPERLQIAVCHVQALEESKAAGELKSCKADVGLSRRLRVYS